MAGNRRDVEVVLIAVGVFFPVYLALFSGIRGLDRKLVEVGIAFRLRGWALVRRVYLPATLPAYFVGLRSGLGLGGMFVVAVEMMGATKGLGYLLVDGHGTGRPGIIRSSVPRRLCWRCCTAPHSAPPSAPYLARLPERHPPRSAGDLLVIFGASRVTLVAT